MCTKLIQIYQKRTPTYLAQITVLVATIMMLVQYSGSSCFLQKTLHHFYWAVLLVAIVELILKLIIFTILYWRTRQIANSFNTIVLFLMAGIHLALWILSIGIYGNDELRVCHKRDQFFMKCYVYTYGIMIIGGAFVFIVLVLSAVGVTITTLKKSKNEQQQEDVEI